MSVVPPIPRINHPLFARFFDRFAAKDEARGQAELRGELLAGLAGRVIEIGAGNGLNFRHYPVAVEELIALEPEPYLRVRAAEAARGAPILIKVVDGLADRIPAEDEAFDAVVASGRTVLRGRPVGGACRDAAGATPGRRASLLRARARGRPGASQRSGGR
jgi:hypothetical protein